MEFLEMLLKQSPWLLDPKAIERDVHLLKLAVFPLIYRERAFLDYSFGDGVYVVTGSRQIGKSTHLKLLIKEKLNVESHESFLYFNCDLLDSKKEIVALVETYLKEFPGKGQRRYVLLDEVTSVPDSFLAVKFLVDRGYEHNITYILTGSNTISIQKTGEHLPGRRGKGVDFHFKPISFASMVHLLHPDIKFDLKWESSDLQFLECTQQLQLRKALNMYMRTGGFPRVINEYFMNKCIGDDIFTIYRSWLTSEIAKGDKKEYIAKRILERCLLSLSTDLSYNSLAQDTGMGSHNTIHDYLDFLSSAHVISPIFHYDLHQQQVAYRKNKKIYFNDPFIYAVIEAWLSGKPQQNYDYLDQAVGVSRIAENIVFLKLAEHDDNVYFYQNSHEIDFVTDRHLVEVKYTHRVIPEDYQRLRDQGTRNAILVTKNKLGRDGPVRFLPLELFLLADSSASSNLPDSTEQIQ